MVSNLNNFSKLQAQNWSLVVQSGRKNVDFVRELDRGGIALGLTGFHGQVCLQASRVLARGISYLWEGQSL